MSFIQYIIKFTAFLLLVLVLPGAKDKEERRVNYDVLNSQIRMSNGYIITANTRNRYLSPTKMCSDSARGIIYVCLSTAGGIAEVNSKTLKTDRVIDLPFDPKGVALDMGGAVLYVSDGKPEGSVHCIGLESGAVIKSLPAGHTPEAICLSGDGKKLFVTNRFSNSISVIDLYSGDLLKNIMVDREPISIDISGDGKILAVANRLPGASGTRNYISGKVSLIDAISLELIKHIDLADGSSSLNDVKFSGNDDFLYVSHILSRYQVPTTQIERGWINTNALSIIDVESQNYLTTVLLDDVTRGAANPYGMTLSNDDKKLYVTLSGVHELCVIDLEKMHVRIQGRSIHRDGKIRQNKLPDIQNELSFLNGIRLRVPLKVKSPRFIVDDGKSVYVSSYFSANLEVLKSEDLTHSVLLPLGVEPEMSEIRKGEMNFSDAEMCFQGWQSCVSCHPDARVDGLTWDLLNDGIGNPKKTKSMLWAHETPPSMITGVRDSAEMAVRAGIRHILFAQDNELKAQEIDAFLSSLRPVPSPFLEDNKLSEKALKGKLVFEAAGCKQCHSGAYYTDGNLYDIYSGHSNDEKARFDTPSLSEAWRNAPYLHDGRAATIREVLVDFNKNGTHGKTGNLTDEELNCLLEYVLSL